MTPDVAEAEHQLLICWHSHTGRTARLVAAAEAGAREASEGAVRVCVRRALQAGPADLLASSALLLATPENFGAMSGGLKDFFERTYYACAGQVEGLPYALLVSAGNDGSGAVRGVQRIARGYPLREVQAPLVVVGDPTEAQLQAAADTGAALAAGVALGVF